MKSLAPMELRRCISVGWIEEASFFREERACSRRRDWKERIVSAVTEDDARAMRRRRVVGPLKRPSTESIGKTKVELHDKVLRPKNLVNSGISRLRPGGDPCR